MRPDRNNLFGPEDRRMFRTWSIIAVIVFVVMLFSAIALSNTTALAAGSIPTKTIYCSIGVSCYGTDSSEAIYGTGVSDYIDARGAFDYVKAHSGPDQVLGGGDTDTIYGGSGNDKLWGDFQQGTVAGDDWLYGEDGDDYLEGNGGRDRLYGGYNNDSINTAFDNNADIVDCGPGYDNVFADKADVVSANCEKVTRAA